MVHPLCPKASLQPVQQFELALRQERRSPPSSNKWCPRSHRWEPVLWDTECEIHPMPRTDAETPLSNRVRKVRARCHPAWLGTIRLTEFTQSRPGRGRQVRSSDSCTRGHANSQIVLISTKKKNSSNVRFSQHGRPKRLVMHCYIPDQLHRH